MGTYRQPWVDSEAKKKVMFIKGEIKRIISSILE